MAIERVGGTEKGDGICQPSQTGGGVWDKSHAARHVNYLMAVMAQLSSQNRQREGEAVELGGRGCRRSKAFLQHLSLTSGRQVLSDRKATVVSGVCVCVVQVYLHTNPLSSTSVVVGHVWSILRD